MFGILVLHEGRPDVALENGTLYGGLHCGDCFRYYAGAWREARLEYADGWVIVCEGGSLPPPYGAQVRL